MILNIKRVKLNNKSRQGYYTRIYDTKSKRTRYYQWKPSQNNEGNRLNYELKYPDDGGHDAPPDGYVEAYEIRTTTHHDTHNQAKGYRSSFKYEAKGIFEFQPYPQTSEKMIKNSLISAFNKGKRDGGKFLKNSVVNSLRGYEVKKVMVKKSEITNTIQATLTIYNNGNVWQGSNK